MKSTIHLEGIKLFAGSSNKPLANKIANAMGMEVSDMETGHFADNESYVRVNELVRGYDVYIVQSLSEPVNDSLMELLIIIDAMKRASAGRITAVIPYFGYARQDRKYSARDPISVKLVADLLETAGIDNVITMDLHSSQIQGFFKKPAINMKGMPLFVDYYRKKIREVDGDFVVVAPSTGAVKRNRQIAEELNIPLAIIDRRSKKLGNKTNNHVIGNIENKNIIMIDDIIDSGNTLCSAADVLAVSNVKSVFAAGIHPVFAGDCGKMIKDTCIEELIVLDTISHEKDHKLDDFYTLSVCDIIANAVISIHKNRSVSRLYNELYEVEK